MLLREINRALDWPRLEAFWRQKGLPRVDLRALPPTGLVACREDGALLAAAFLVKSDTNMASLAFVCGNPATPREERSEALDAVILSLAEIALRAGFSCIGAASNVLALQARYERLGFKLTDENVRCYGGFL